MMDEDEFVMCKEEGDSQEVFTVIKAVNLFFYKEYCRMLTRF